MMNEKNKCKECEFWKKIDTEYIDGKKNWGQCRKSSPRASWEQQTLIGSPCDNLQNVTILRIRWPETEPDDWCGEFKHKINIDEPSPPKLEEYSEASVKLEIEEVT